MVRFERRKKNHVNLNITPLIDVVFLLLIFFMLTSAFAAKSGIKISLPKAASAKQQDADTITLLIDNSRTIYINGRKISFAELQERVSGLISAGAKRQLILIKADRHIDLGFAVKVIDMAKEADAGGVIISTESLPQGRK